MPTPSPSLRSHSTAPEVISLIDDDDDDMAVDNYPPRHSVGFFVPVCDIAHSAQVGPPSPPMVVKSESSVDIVRSVI